ncbi:MULTISPECIES: exopolysaccharide biosynthesis protein [Thalassospira]|uniref:Uncharacterized conserved protein n=1 Tax=Thalassospira xiamenensis TaxID=220697 RepID=A0A285RAN9_9PROT|nr:MULTISPECIES: exopolysaccharide biosynthesis protein [Thalassospira]MCH2276453.1 exopolysaccharide biosynthesis protein [Thalassospira sp.]SOB89447.1 Uncharacterized conserved protein [Thalassospira xiamenensis]
MTRTDDLLPKDGARLSSIFDALLNDDQVVPPADGAAQGTDPDISPDISLGALFDAMGEKSQGALIVLFALIACVPVPGPNAILTIPLAFLALQLVIGRKKLYLPDWMRRRRIGRRRLSGLYRHMRPRLIWLENRMSDRWQFFVPAQRMPVIGLICLVIAFIIAIPIPVPGANSIPALCLVVVGLGLVLSDGVAIAAGILVGGVAATGIAGLTWYSVTALAA